MICNACNLEMTNVATNSCIKVPVFISKGKNAGKKTQPIPSYYEEEGRCHDCNIAPGGYHHPGCDMERCPSCGGQLISCGCLDSE